MPFFLAPVVNDQQTDAVGRPLNGGRVFTFLAGTSTPATTYTTQLGGPAQANPVVLNTLGVALNPIWLDGGTAIKFVVQDALGNVLRTLDNVSGVNDVSSVATEWVLADTAPVFLTASSFRVNNNQTGLYPVGRRVRTQNTSGLVYSTVVSAVFGSPFTVVTTLNDSTPLDTGLNRVDVSFLSPVGSAVPGIPASRVTGLPAGTNYIINGNFQVQQAPLFANVPFSSVQDFDGWQIANNTGGVMQPSNPPTVKPGTRSRQIVVTNPMGGIAASDFLTDQTFIEGSDLPRLVGNTFTLNFKARVPVPGVHCVAINNALGTVCYVAPITFVAADIVQDVVVTVVGGLPTFGTWNYNAGVGLRINFVHAAGANSITSTANAWVSGAFLATAAQVNDAQIGGRSWALEGVSLALGVNPTINETPYNIELTRCKRYYERGWEFTQVSNAVFNTNIINLVRFGVSKTFNAAATITFQNITYNTATGLSDSTSTNGGGFKQDLFAYQYTYLSNGTGSGTPASVSFNWVYDGRLP